jgi:hypothetical protein
LLVHNDALWVGGVFLVAGGQRVNHLALWQDNTWHALGAGLDDSVYALAAYQNTLWVGGAFMQAGSGFSPFLAGLQLSQQQPRKRSKLPFWLLLEASD